MENGVATPLNSWFFHSIQLSYDHDRQGTVPTTPGKIIGIRPSPLPMDPITSRHLIAWTCSSLLTGFLDQKWSQFLRQVWVIYLPSGGRKVILHNHHSQHRLFGTVSNSGWLNESTWVFQHPSWLLHKAPNFLTSTFGVWVPQSYLPVILLCPLWKVCIFWIYTPDPVTVANEVLVRDSLLLHNPGGDDCILGGRPEVYFQPFYESESYFLDVVPFPAFSELRSILLLVWRGSSYKHRFFWCLLASGEFPPKKNNENQQTTGR